MMKMMISVSPNGTGLCVVAFSLNVRTINNYAKPMLCVVKGVSMKVEYQFYAEDGSGNSDFFETLGEAISWCKNSIGTDLINGDWCEPFVIYQAVKVVNLDESVSEIESK